MSLTSLPAQLAGVLVLGVLVAYWLGYGATRWLLPRAWLPYRWLLMPAVGLTLFAVIAQPLGLLGVNSAMLIAMLFPLALIANVLAFWKALQVDKTVARREIIAPIGIALAVLVLGVLPFFTYGYLTVMGYNVDGSTYVAQAEFAKRFGLNRDLLIQIPSVYAESVVHVITVGVGAVGPLWHSVLSQLMARDAFYSYTPVLVLWFGFSFLSVYCLYRLTFRMQVWTSILTLAALALNAMLWLIPLDNFALHTFALALLPLEWMATQYYLETRERRVLVLAALTLGAQILTYPEATPFYILPFVLYLGLSAVREWRIPWDGIVRWVQIGVLSLVLAPTAYWTLYAGAVHQSQTLVHAVGGTVETFISLAAGIGFGPLSLVEHEGMVAWEFTAREVWNVVVWIVFAILVLCALVGAWQSIRSDRRFLTASGGAMIVALAWMFFVQSYPYGFFKTWVTTLFVLLAFCALGIETGIKSLRRPGRTRRFVLIPVALISLLFVLEGLSMLGFEKGLADRPPVVTRKLIQLANSDVIPPKASVYLSLSDTPNPRMYWAAYFLRDHPLFGSGLVAYSAIQNAQDGVLYDYALLNREENPVEFDYAPDAIAWDDRWTVLYQRR